jgi:putative acetyltransferase
MPLHSGVIIRDQTTDDFAAVHELVIAAFKTLPIACGREQFVMDALWTSGAATVALVAEDSGAAGADAIVGQAAFSKATVGGQDVGWHGCGPVSVPPKRHKQGIGSALMRAGLNRLRALGSKGCVVVGDPNYYPRFGFANTDAMFEPGVPPEVFMAICFAGAMPKGEVKFDEAFDAKG